MKPNLLLATPKPRFICDGRCRKLVDDEDFAEALKEKGLGTPATSASTIEHLIKEKYLRREGTEIIPSLKAEDLFQFLHAAGVEILTSPAMTGEWEQKLRQIEEGKMTRESFHGRNLQAY